jgi:hypothetical protein
MEQVSGSCDPVLCSDRCYQNWHLKIVVLFNFNRTFYVWPSTQIWLDIYARCYWKKNNCRQRGRREERSSQRNEKRRGKKEARRERRKDSSFISLRLWIVYNWLNQCQRVAVPAGIDGVEAGFKLFEVRPVAVFCHVRTHSTTVTCADCCEKNLNKTTIPTDYHASGFSLSKPISSHEVPRKEISSLNWRRIFTPFGNLIIVHESLSLIMRQINRVHVLSLSSLTARPV